MKSANKIDKNHAEPKRQRAKNRARRGGAGQQEAGEAEQKAIKSQLNRAKTLKFKMFWLCYDH